MNEGIFFADRKTEKIYGRTHEEVQQKINNLLSADKDNKHKMKQEGSIKQEGINRFIGKVSYQVNDKENTETIFGKLSRGFDKTKNIIQKGIDTGKKIYSEIPKRGKLTAENKFKLGQEQAKFTKDHPDVKYGNVYKNSDGTFSIDYYAKEGTSEKENKNFNKRLNNIQKQLAKLSNDKLDKIEDIIKS